MTETISERRRSASDPREGDDGKWDVLGALVYASADLDEGEKQGDGGEIKNGSLTEREVMGNMFALIGAGHGKLPFDTSASEECD